MMKIYTQIVQRSIVGTALAAVILGGVTSCSKQAEEPQMETRERVLNIEKAQKFFESRVNTSTKSRQSLIVPSEFDVDWKGAKYRYPKDRAEVVSAGIKSDEVIIAKIGGKVVDTYRELRVMSGVKFSHTLTFIATHIPLEGYTLTDEMRAAAVKGHSRDDKFTGIVLVHNLDGFFFSAERYVEGELLSCLVITNGYGGQQEIDNIVATKFLNGIQLYSVNRKHATKSDRCPYCGSTDCGYSGTGDYNNGNPGSCGNPFAIPNPTIRPAPKFEYVESGYDWSADSWWGDPYGYTEGGGVGGTPQGPLTMSLQKAQYAFDQMVSKGKVLLSEVIGNNATQEISYVDIKIGERNVHVYNFALAFGAENPTAYIVVSLDNPQRTSWYPDGYHYIFKIKTVDGGLIGSMTVGAGDKGYIEQIFSKVPKP